MAQTVRDQKEEVEKLQASLKAERKKLEGVQANLAAEKKKTEAVDSLKGQVKSWKGECTVVTWRLV